MPQCEKQVDRCRVVVCNREPVKVGIYQDNILIYSHLYWLSVMYHIIISYHHIMYKGLGAFLSMKHNHGGRISLLIIKECVW